jgi:hypothetical protein
MYSSAPRKQGRPTRNKAVEINNDNIGLALMPRFQSRDDQLKYNTQAQFKQLLTKSGYKSSKTANVETAGEVDDLLSLEEMNGGKHKFVLDEEYSLDEEGVHKLIGAAVEAQLPKAAIHVLLSTNSIQLSETLSQQVLQMIKQEGTSKDLRSLRRLLQTPASDSSGAAVEAQLYQTPLCLPQSALPDLVAYCIQKDQPEEALHWFLAFQEVQGGAPTEQLQDKDKKKGIGRLSREVSETVCSLLLPALAGVGSSGKSKSAQSWDGLFYVLSEMRLHNIPLSVRAYSLLVKECESAPAERWTHARRWALELYADHFMPESATGTLPVGVGGLGALCKVMASACKTLHRAGRSAEAVHLWTQLSSVLGMGLSEGEGGSDRMPEDVKAILGGDESWSGGILAEIAGKFRGVIEDITLCWSCLFLCGVVY